MDWDAYERLGVGAKFEEKPGRDGGGSGWHWYKSHKPGQGRDAPVPPKGSPERTALIEGEFDGVGPNYATSAKFSVLHE
jgi:hypothetical protein